MEVEGWVALGADPTGGLGGGVAAASSRCAAWCLLSWAVSQPSACSVLTVQLCPLAKHLLTGKSTGDFSLPA